MHTALIIDCLKKHGQLLDLEISEETGIPLSAVRFSLSALSERGGFSPSFSMNRRSAAKNRNQNRSSPGSSAKHP
ncbi:MAG: hypothetical protein J0J02_10580 [Thiobacillus sp.]|nr:hypothetical protein [Thiobacillus sp.]